VNLAQPDLVPAPVAELLRRFAVLPTTVITDEMERFGSMSADIKPVWDGAVICAQARTVWTREGDNLGIHKALEEVEPGRVIVVAGGGMLDRALLGDLIAERAVNAGVAGFVVDGAVRDAEGIEESGLPVFARAAVPAGPYKSGPFRLGEPIAAGGVVVSDGDIVCGDANGVVVIPLLAAEELLPRAEAKLAHEESTRENLIRVRS
jgi:regulator of RNase E activity RraA